MPASSAESESKLPNASYLREARNAPAIHLSAATVVVGSGLNFQLPNLATYPITKSLL